MRGRSPRRVAGAERSVPQPIAPRTVSALLLGLTGIDIASCPVCQAGRLRIVAILAPTTFPVPPVMIFDTS